MDSIRTIKNTISISLFNQGIAEEIFKKVKKNGTVVVMKNDLPECVMISPEEYLRLMDEINDMELLMTVADRLQNFNKEDLIDGEDVFKRLGISDEKIANFDKTPLE